MNDKQRALEVRCSYCGAAAGKPCRARTSGFDRKWPHADRVSAAKEVTAR